MRRSGWAASAKAAVDVMGAEMEGVERGVAPLRAMRRGGWSVPVKVAVGVVDPEMEGAARGELAEVWWSCVRARRTTCSATLRKAQKRIGGAEGVLDGLWIRGGGIGGRMWPSRGGCRLRREGCLDFGERRG